MSIVLVALDTVRADHLGCYGYRFPTSPTLDAFAETAVRFETCRAPGIPTTPSYQRRSRANTLSRTAS